MWPWGHLAVAYLVYHIYTYRRYNRAPLALPLIALAIGSQFPDLIDKPLAWSFDILPGGRTLGHSVFFALLLIPAVYALASWIGRDRFDIATAFVIGHVSHLVADIPPAAFTGDLESIRFFFWPIVSQPDYGTEPGSLLDGFLRYSMGTYEWAQLLLLGVAIIVWYRDGMPGIDFARLTLERYSPAR